MQMSLFVWEVEKFEKDTGYFKSLNLKRVCHPLTEKKREKLALALHQSQVEEDLVQDDEVSDGIDASVQKEEIGGSVGRIRSTFSKEYELPSKKRLFSDRNSKV